MGRSGLAVYAMIAATVITACGSGPREGEALSLDPGAERICVPSPADAGDGTIFGGTWFEHRGVHDVTFTGIVLVNPRGLTLIEALLVPDPWPNGDLVGMRHTSAADPFPAQWEDRIALEGATLQPAASRNLVVVVGADGSDVAVADGLRLEYEDARGRRYHQEVRVELMVAEPPCDEALGFDED